MHNNDTLIATTFRTAAAAERCAAADAAFAAAFVALPAEAQARSWRGLDHGSKFRLIVRRIEALGLAWMPSTVAEYIAKYDERFQLGPVEAAVEGALERLAEDHSRHAATAATKDDRAFFRRAATAFTNALIQYRAGVRPELLASGAWLLPSSRAGEPPHIVRLDGDFVCSCTAQGSMHWPIALIVAIEQSHEDMQNFDDPPFDDNPMGDSEGDEEPAYRPLGPRLCAARAAYADAA